MFSSAFDTYFSLQGGCGRKAYYAITPDRRYSYHYPVPGSIE